MYRTTLLILLVTNFVATSDALLRYMTQLHTTEDKPGVWGYGDVHTIVSNPHWEQWRDIEERQLDCVRTCMEAYNGKEPLHIFIEGSSYRKFQCYSKNLFFDYLYGLLVTSITGTNHVVEDFDIRKLLAIPIMFFSNTRESPDLRLEYIDFYGDGMRRADGINTDEVTFDEVWSEIEAYHYAISYACEAYFADDYEGSLASHYLTEAMTLYLGLRRSCEEWGIMPDHKVKATGNHLLREPRLYHKEDSLQSLREHILTTFLSIAGYLTDVSLCLKVLLAHQRGSRVIVFAGASHIRRLRELLIDRGFCNGGELSLIYRGQLLSHELDTAFDSSPDKCSLGKRCLYPFTPKLPKKQSFMGSLLTRLI